MRVTTRATSFAVLAVGVVIVSTASILIRWAQADGLSSLVIAAGRLGIAAIVLLPFAWPALRGTLATIDRRTFAFALLAGAALALHFASWISSLEHTSVASSTALVTTNPLWVGLASALLLRERTGALAWLGIALSLAGSFVIVVSDGSGTVRPGAGSALFGNALALVGAVAASVYLLLGRAVRNRLPLLAWVWLVYAVAGVLLVLLALVTPGATWQGASATAWLAVVAMAIGPQLIGHTAFNHAVRHLSATFTAVAILGEPIGSACLAWLLLGERVSGGQVTGFCAIAAGIVAAAVGEQAGRRGVTR